MRFLPMLACALLIAAFPGCGAGRQDPAPAAGGVAPAGALYDRVMAAKKLRVGVKADTPPFGMRRGATWTGFDLDIAHAVARQLGVDLELVPVTSRDRDDQLIAGTVDIVIASYTITRFRERDIDFTIPYFQDGQALLVPAGSAIQSYLDLAGKRVGTVKGSTSSFYLKQVAPDAKGEVVADFDALIAALRAGKVDAITSDRLILLGLTRLAPDREKFQLAGAPFTVEPYGIALPQDQSRLRDALNAALMAIWEDGTWKTIADTWFGPGATYAGEVSFTMAVVPK